MQLEPLAPHRRPEMGVNRVRRRFASALVLAWLAVAAVVIAADRVL